MISNNFFLRVTYIISILSSRDSVRRRNNYKLSFKQLYIFAFTITIYQGLRLFEKMCDKSTIMDNYNKVGQEIFNLECAKYYFARDARVLIYRDKTTQVKKYFLPSRYHLYRGMLG